MKVRNSKTFHRLSNVDPDRRTAVCWVCGPTEIYVGKASKNGAVRRVCINKLRESTQDYKRRMRQKKGLPEPIRKPRHLLSEIDTEMMTAICSVCGPTDIRKRNDGKKHPYYFCNTKKKQDAEAYRRSLGIPPLNPSHHRLSQIDDENRTARCSKCGPVRIYIVRQGDRILRRCINSQRTNKNQAQ